MTKHTIYEKHCLIVHMMYKSRAQTNQLFWHKHFVFNLLMLFAVVLTFDGLFWYALTVFVKRGFKEVCSLAIQKILLSLKLFMITQENKLVWDLHNKQGGKWYGKFYNLVMKNECYGLIWLLCAVMVTSATKKGYFCMNSKKDDKRN